MTKTLNTTPLLASRPSKSEPVLPEPARPEPARPEPARPEPEMLAIKPFQQTERLDVELDFTRIIPPANSTSQSHAHVLFAPVHYEPEYAYPLLVWLHGPGGDERQVMRIMPAVSMRNYVAVAPRGLTVNGNESAGPIDKFDVSSILRGGVRSKEFYDWFDSDEDFAEMEQRIFDCITTARERCNIASNRIFLAGFGSGGTTALRLALLYPNHFAGVASLGGVFPKNGRILQGWEAIQPFSVFLAVGESSTECSPESACRTLELFHTAGVAVKVREYACGQELVPPMLQDLNRWMMEIVCG